MFDSIQGKGFTIKEKSAPEYFLGRNFEHVKEPKTYNDILKWGSKTYVKRMMDNFKNTFRFETFNKHASVPPEHNPKLTTTEIWNNDNKDLHWEYIGLVQWDVALGCIDIICATVVLYWYWPAPSKGKLSNIHNLYGYLNKYTSTSTKLNTEIIDYGNFNKIEGNWGNLYSVEPEDIPPSCTHHTGNPVLISIFFDPNLMDDLATGISKTGIIHILNKTPIEWY